MEEMGGARVASSRKGTEIFEDLSNLIHPGLLRGDMFNFLFYKVFVLYLNIIYIHISDINQPPPISLQMLSFSLTSNHCDHFMVSNISFQRFY